MKTEAILLASDIQVEHNRYMTTTLYHGAHTKYEPHLGQCYTDDQSAAYTYADQGMHDGETAEIEIDLSSLIIERVDGYDRDADAAPGDRDIAGLACDIIWYTDEDIRGREHECWRIVSARALAAITHTKFCEEF